ncbi:MAG: hypothetical protein K0S86_205 [Geminicoccaceae bacterium]|nr:hypothetical protein [Geminicoccaceae bacterium]
MSTSSFCHPSSRFPRHSTGRSTRRSRPKSRSDWAFNGDGQAGLTLVAKLRPESPERAGSPHVLSQVSVRARHSCAITTSGEAVCRGDNTSGQLGNGTTAPPVVPVVLPAPEG